MQPFIELLQSLIDSSRERLRSPTLGSFLIAWVFVNWKISLYVLFSDRDYDSLIEMISDTGYLTLVGLPFMLGLGYSLVGPWVAAGLGWVRVRAEGWFKGDRLRIQAYTETKRGAYIRAVARNEAIKLEALETREKSIEKERIVGEIDVQPGESISDAIAANLPAKDNEPTVDTDFESVNEEDYRSITKAMIHLAGLSNSVPDSPSSYLTPRFQGKVLHDLLRNWGLSASALEDVFSTAISFASADKVRVELSFFKANITQIIHAVDESSTENDIAEAIMHLSTASVNRFFSILSEAVSGEA
ncbi:MAG: hypothetical protein AAF515_05145 [Pseudomonadota bacterium]